MKRLIKLSMLSMVIFCSMGTLKAQYADEALLFGNTAFGGSARIQGMGGTQVSLGGDISSTLSNPAGLGFYNRSEVSFTPIFNFQNASSKAAGVTTDVFKSNFALNQLGVVINMGKDDIQQGAWRGGSLGISYTKTNNFNNRTSYEQNGVTGDLITYLLDQTNDQISYNQIGEVNDIIKWGYDHYLINPDPDGDGIDDYVSITSQFPNHQVTLDTKGHQSQWSFSYGANYDDMFYFGGSIGIVSINYSSDRTITETFEGSTDDPYLFNEVKENYNTQGSGVNATFGVIIRPVNFMTVGFSAVSPTLYDIKSEYSESLYTDYAGYYFEEEDVELEDFFSESDLYVSNYSLRTPAKLNAGATFFIGKHGFLSGDVELVNYANSKLSAQDFSVNQDNQEIKNRFQNVVNYKVGGEYRLDIFRFRAGYALYADPNKNTDTIDRSRTVISGGFGVKTRDYSVDLAIVNAAGDSFYSPFGYSDSGATTTTTNTTAMVTVGFTF